ncbi:MAG: hypothetical protein K0R66_1145 [Gammaproteobacteria bacterium]|jgi:hypothetical protein|nr:hypothetical protein [Gammaproteobacteria bacterium]
MNISFIRNRETSLEGRPQLFKWTMLGLAILLTFSLSVAVLAIAAANRKQLSLRQLPKGGISGLMPIGTPILYPQPSAVYVPQSGDAEGVIGEFAVLNTLAIDNGLADAPTSCEVWANNQLIVNATSALSGANQVDYVNPRQFGNLADLEIILCDGPAANISLSKQLRQDSQNLFQSAQTIFSFSGEPTQTDKVLTLTK